MTDLMKIRYIAEWPNEDFSEEKDLSEIYARSIHKTWSDAMGTAERNAKNRGGHMVTLEIWNPNYYGSNGGGWEGVEQWGEGDEEDYGWDL